MAIKCRSVCENPHNRRVCAYIQSQEPDPRWSMIARTPAGSSRSLPDPLLDLASPATEAIILRELDQDRPFRESRAAHAGRVARSGSLPSYYPRWSQLPCRGPCGPTNAWRVFRPAAAWLVEAGRRPRWLSRRRGDRRALAEPADLIPWAGSPPRRPTDPIRNDRAAAPERSDPEAARAISPQPVPTEPDRPPCRPR
jgi:hypothetical protein